MEELRRRARSRLGAAVLIETLTLIGVLGWVTSGSIIAYITGSLLGSAAWAALLITIITYRQTRPEPLKVYMKAGR